MAAVRAFLSYPWVANASDDVVEAFRTRLEGSLRSDVAPDSFVFRDKNAIPVGAHLSITIRDALASSDVFIPLLCPAWFASAWCPQEARAFQALHAAGTTQLVPIKWADFNEDDVPPDLRDDLLGRLQDDWRDLRHHLAGGEGARIVDVRKAISALTKAMRPPAPRSVQPAAAVRPPTPATLDVALADFLKDAFPSPELESFVRQRVTNGRILLHHLPSPPGPRAAFAEAVVDLLRRHNLINHALFDALLAARPGRRAEIVRLRGLL